MSEGVNEDKRMGDFVVTKLGWGVKPAYNERFCKMAAVAPQTILYGNERLYLAGSLVEAATTPSRWDVIGKRVDSTAGH